MIYILKSKMTQKEMALNNMKSTLSSIHSKEILANGHVFDKDMEIRKLKNEIQDLKSKLEILTNEVIFLVPKINGSYSF